MDENQELLDEQVDDYANEEVTEQELDLFDDCIREVDSLEEQRKTNRQLLDRLTTLEADKKELVSALKEIVNETANVNNSFARSCHYIAQTLLNKHKPSKDKHDRY